jgi:hypothetical protein
MLAANAKDKNVQGRVRVIGKGETCLMFFVACPVPKTVPQVSESYAGFVIAAAA